MWYIWTNVIEHNKLLMKLPLYKIAKKKNDNSYNIWCWLMQVCVYNLDIKVYFSPFLLNHKVVILVRSTTAFKAIPKIIYSFMMSTKFHIFSVYCSFSPNLLLSLNILQNIPSKHVIPHSRPSLLTSLYD